MTENQMKELANTINQMQSAENWGHGINCVKSLVQYLEHGYFEKACAVANNEWDKISSYHQIAQCLIENKLYTPINW